MTTHTCLYFRGASTFGTISGQKGSIVVRHVVGGKICTGVSTPIDSFIRVRSDDFVMVYLNGRLLRIVLRRQRAQKVPVRLRCGDVVSFKVVNRVGWGAVLIDVFHNGKHHYSGISKAYKAHLHSLHGQPTVIPSTWTTQSFNSYKWNIPKKIHGGPKRTFPVVANTQLLKPFNE